MSAGNRKVRVLCEWSEVGWGHWSYSDCCVENPNLTLSDYKCRPSDPLCYTSHNIDLWVGNTHQRMTIERINYHYWCCSPTSYPTNKHNEIQSYYENIKVIKIIMAELFFSISLSPRLLWITTDKNSDINKNVIVRHQNVQ